MEVEGTPCNISTKNLESKELEVFGKVGCEIASRDIETCDRFANNNDRIIVTFSKRKNCNQVMSAKSDLRKVKLEDVKVNRG